MTWSTTAWSSYFAPAGGGGGTANPLIVSSVTVAATQVTINMSANFVLLFNSAEPSAWKLTSPGLSDLTIFSVTKAGNSIVLATSEHRGGATYTIAFPEGILQTTDGTFFAGPYTRTYTGVGANPSLVQVQGVDARSILVTFSEPVNEVDATTPTNYSLTGPTPVLAVGVTKVSAVQFSVQTTEQQQGGSYSVTVSNIRDLAGNVIA